MKFLMCPPRHYEVVYEINTWMDKERKVNQKEAHKQYKNLKKVYTGLGIKVLEIEQEKGLPDMVYSANYGFVHRDFFVKSNFFNKERRREADLAAGYMQELGYKVKTLPKDLFFEGQGDLFYCNGRFISGYGFRTQIQSISALEDLLQEKVEALQLVDPRWYHLDTCFFPLKDNKALIAAEAFDKASLNKLQKMFKELITLETKEDIQNFSCNSVLIGDNIVTNKMSSQLKNKLKEKGYKVIETPTSEFIKGGGSVRCLTLDIPS